MRKSTSADLVTLLDQCSRRIYHCGHQQNRPHREWYHLHIKPQQSLQNCQERVSDSTKEQRGRGRTRNNGQVVRKCRALVKGCRERTRARGCVSSQEKVHTNKNLARATAKPRAGRRQSWQTCRSGQKRIQRLSRAPASEATKGEWD